MRIGDYRVLYFVLEKKVRVTEILHRSQAYRGLDGVRQAVDRSTGRGLGRVRYLLVGGYASVVHGVPRTTLDVDLALLGPSLGHDMHRRLRDHGAFRLPCGAYE